MRPPLPLVLEAAAARSAGALSRLAGRGGGTTLPGKLLWKLDPGAIDRPRPHSRIFGLDDPRHARTELPHAADSKYCLRCGTPYVYSAVYLGHLGDYRCPKCGHARPPIDVIGRAIELHGLDGSAFTISAPEGDARVELALPGLYNVYNAIGAASLALELGVPLAEVVEGLASFSAAFGRFERISIGDRRLLM